MRQIYFSIILCIVFGSCQQIPKETKIDFEEEVVDLAIRLKNNEPIELSTLYDSLASKILEDSLKILILAERLKEKGFQVTAWGRGNIPPSVFRIVSLTLRKENCECTVNKMYSITSEEKFYQLQESISCKAIN